MRVHLQQDASLATFSKQLFDIVNGKVPIIDAVTKCISFPANFCNIMSFTEQIIQNAFPYIATNYKNHEWLCESVILAEKNNDVNTINNIIQGKILGKCTIYKSIDTIMDTDEIVNYPIQFFNSLDITGVPPYVFHSELVCQ